MPDKLGVSIVKYLCPICGKEADNGIIMNSLLTEENAKEVEQLIIDMVSDIQVDNSRIDFDNEFAQNYDSLILLFVEVIKLNYLESFQRLVTNLPKE